MITLTLVVILGALLGIVLMQLFKKQPAPVSRPYAAKPEPPDLANLKVTDARAGDVISVSGAGDAMTDLDFTADRLTHVEARARRWFELAGPYRARSVAWGGGGGEGRTPPPPSTPTRASLPSRTWASPKTTWPKWTSARTPPIRSSSTARCGSTASAAKPAPSATTASRP